MTTTFKPGDVLRYVPERHHCREGTAFVAESGMAIDTYWRTYGDGDSHPLTADEIATGELLFNVADYDALDCYSAAARGTWETYHPDDRGRISSQHGLREALFVRSGATPDLNTQIENAHARVVAAEVELQWASRSLKLRREELAALEAQRSPAAAHRGLR